MHCTLWQAAGSVKHICAGAVLEYASVLQGTAHGCAFLWLQQAAINMQHTLAFSHSTQSQSPENHTFESTSLPVTPVAGLQDVIEPSSTPAVDANQAIAGLPGVDPNDPSVQEALKNVKGDKKDGDDKK